MNERLPAFSIPPQLTHHSRRNPIAFVEGLRAARGDGISRQRRSDAAIIRRAPGPSATCVAPSRAARSMAWPQLSRGPRQRRPDETIGLACGASNASEFGVLKAQAGSHMPLADMTPTPRGSRKFRCWILSVDDIIEMRILVVLIALSRCIRRWRPTRSRSTVPLFWCHARPASASRQSWRHGVNPSADLRQPVWPTVSRQNFVRVCVDGDIPPIMRQLTCCSDRVSRSVIYPCGYSIFAPARNHPRYPALALTSALLRLARVLTPS